MSIPLPASASDARRLTRLYSDAKHSCDAVVERDHTGCLPELSRKISVQRARLLEWGWEWADNSPTATAKGDIDEPLARAGLTETVTGVLSTIKGMLDEAERMQIHSVGGEKGPAPADLARYEDLARDLASSIDILFDVSRARKGTDKALLRSEKGGDARMLGMYSPSEITLVDPTDPSTTRTNTALSSMSKAPLPPKIDPENLILPEEEPPPYESIGVTPATRLVGRMRQQHLPLTASSSWHSDAQMTELPVLVEYATYDSTYKVAGASPPTERLELLLSLLVRLSSESPRSGTLPCVGYFEDPDQPRYGLVYSIPSTLFHPLATIPTISPPSHLRPVTLLSLLQLSSKSPNNPSHTSLAIAPPLEDRFRLAYTLVTTFSKFHGEGLTHRHVNSANVLLFPKPKPKYPPTSHYRVMNYDLRAPVVASWDVFSEFSIEHPTPSKASLSQEDAQDPSFVQKNLYRHPLDPFVSMGANTPSAAAKAYSPAHDLYALGLTLLEIGLWIPLADLFKPKYSLKYFKQRLEELWIRRLAAKCGSAYMQAVRGCFTAVEATDGRDGEDLLAPVYAGVLKRLERCCLIDEDESDEDLRSLGRAGPGFTTSAARRKKSMLPGAGESHPLGGEEGKGESLLSSQTHVLRSQAVATDLGGLMKKAAEELRGHVGGGVEMFTASARPESEVDWHGPYDGTSRREAPPPVGRSNSNLVTPATVNQTQAYKEKVVAAANTIQRAWRARCGKISFREYRRKIIVLQKQWRRRQAAVASGFASQSRSLTNPASTLPTSTVESNRLLRTPAEEGVETRIPPPTNLHVTACLPSNQPRSPTKPKLHIHPHHHFPSEVTTLWHDSYLPRLEKLVAHALRDSPETISIDLLAVGATPAVIRPTIFVTCTSVPKVRKVLEKRFVYDTSTFYLKVRRGTVRRSKAKRAAAPSAKRSRARRSMAPPPPPPPSRPDDPPKAGHSCSLQPLNPHYQSHPTCGASIGAWREEVGHLPPVSFGGLIEVDGELMGMSVHHALDAPSEEEEGEEDDEGVDEGADAALGAEGHIEDSLPVRSSSKGADWIVGVGGQEALEIGEGVMDGRFEISDDDADDDEEGNDWLYDSDAEAGTSEYEADSSEELNDDDDDAMSLASSAASTIGDVPGIPPPAETPDRSYRKEISFTQPAIDDVDPSFFPSEEDRDEEHLASHLFAEVHASSGIRRRTMRGVRHEVDWVVLDIGPERLLTERRNVVRGGARWRGLPPAAQREGEDEYPVAVRGASELAGLRVHCLARTSGLTGGVVGAAMSAVRIWGRRSMSRSWTVMGGFGVGGDSGAWIIDDAEGKVCGHVLAWCDRLRLTYLCPMEVLLEDIRRTLRARVVRLPGAETAAAAAATVLEGVPPPLGRNVAPDGHDAEVCFPGRKQQRYLVDLALEMDGLGREMAGLGLGGGDGGGGNGGAKMIPAVAASAAAPPSVSDGVVKVGRERREAAGVGCA